MLDKLFFLKLMKDEDYVDDTFLSIPLNIYTILTFVLPVMISPVSPIHITIIQFGCWIVAVNQFYWFRKISLEKMVKDEKEQSTKK